MRIVWLCILLAIVASAFLADAFTTTSNANGNTPISARKLIKDVGDVGLYDYGAVDPSPSSKRLQPGPIQHGTPMIPYIPKPSPPPSPSA